VSFEMLDWIDDPTGSFEKSAASAKISAWHPEIVSPDTK